MDDLYSKRCLACETGVKPLTQAELNTLLNQVPLWTINTEATQISRRFTFKNFYHTMGFVNAVAYIANQENHHPDMEVGYDYCVVRYQTHAMGGLSENDFICASKVDRL